MLRYMLRQLAQRSRSETIPTRHQSKNLLTESNGFNRCVLGREGYVVYNSNDIYIGRAVERYGEYAETEANLLRQFCQPGAVVIEAGANIGTHTQVLSRAVGSTGFVYAYEPQRVVFQTLCANLALNSTINVDARCAAVGAESGYVVLPDFDYTREWNFGGIAVDQFQQGRKVPKVTLDTDLELSRLDLIKIDVEGMELDVLRGADQLLHRFNPLLYVENDRMEKSEALIRHLLTLNYRLYWHLPKLYNPANFFNNDENIYVDIVSANMVGVPHSSPMKMEGLVEITSPSQHILQQDK